MRKENKVLKSFKTYHDLMYKLSNLYFDYYRSFNQLEQQIFKESVLNEKVSDREKEEIENKISDLENNISKILSSISSHLKIMEILLKKENVALQETEVNQVNRMHISTMGDYNTCIQRLKSLEREYKEWDFSKVNFSQTDTEKMKLNIAIKKYNDNNLKLMDYKLYGVFEAQRIAKEEADEAIKWSAQL